MKKVTRLFFLNMLVTLATFVALVGSVSASAVAPIDGYGAHVYKIVNRNSGKVLEVSKTGQIDQRDYDGGQNQQWRIDFVFESNSSYSLENMASKLYLTDPSLHTPNPTQDQQLVQQAGSGGPVRDDTAGYDQTWNITQAKDDSMTIQSMKELHVGVQGASTDNGAPVVLSSSNQQPEQQWQFICVAHC